jgi:hypothetical protein
MTEIFQQLSAPTFTSIFVNISLKAAGLLFRILTSLVSRYADLKF